MSKTDAPKIDNSIGPKLFMRDEHGLLKNIQYQFNDNGTIDWRQMIDPEFLYVNREWFERRNEAAPNSIDGLNDRQLLIMLGGLKELAQLRGYESVTMIVNASSEDFASVTCRIRWKPNYETGGCEVEHEEAADAHKGNTDAWCANYLTTIAANRAFVRAVRNFLGIHIVGSDEVGKGDAATSPAIPEGENLSASSPQGVLMKKAAQQGMVTFEEFLPFLKKLYEEGKYQPKSKSKWASFADIPPKNARELVGLLS